MTTRKRPPKAVPIDQDDTPETATTVPKAPRKPAFFAASETITEDTADPFTPDDDATDADMLEEPASDVAKPRRRHLSLSKIAAAAFGLVFSIAIALWLDGLIQSFFARAAWLGWLTTALVAVGVVSLAAIVIREIGALIRLDDVQSLRELAAEAVQEKKPAKARTVVSRLRALLSTRPETARDRARFADYEDEIIDGPHLVDLAETELLVPLDRQARSLIMGASKRVSVVTAISPRALIGIGYVLFEAVRLVRRLSFLYGGRPGTLGMMRLTRDVVSHLAVTGSLAVGDGVVHQLVGEGLANRLSVKLGEGVVNGLMTARIGIAAMDLCRPLPFRAAKRPGIGEFVNDLTRQAAGADKTIKG